MTRTRTIEQTMLDAVVRNLCSSIQAIVAATDRSRHCVHRVLQGQAL